LLINALLHHHEEETCEIGTTSSVFHIEGMHCSHCAANVERAIQSIEGVEDVSVSLSENIAVVSGDIDEKLIHSAVESLGYKIK
jgi:copper chaperone CopZ